MKRVIVSILLLLASMQSHAQITGNAVSAESGYSFQYHICYEIGIDYGVNWLKSDSIPLATDVWENDSIHYVYYRHGNDTMLFRHLTVYPTLASEFYFTRHSFYIGPKLMVSFIWNFITCRVSIIDYTNTKVNQHDLRFTPEIGLIPKMEGVPSSSNEVDFIAFYYGYNIPIGTERIYDVPGNRFTIVIKPIMYR